MKRRKKLWIAYGVLALCAFALLYRPVRYRFLEGTTLVSVRSHVGSVRTYWSGPGRPASDLTVHEYRTARSAFDVFDTAYKELKPNGDWEHVITIGGGSYECINNRTDEMIAIDYIDYDLKGKEPFVRIQEIHPTTAIDRVLVWLYNR